MDDVSGSVLPSVKTLDRPYIFVQKDGSPFTVSYGFVDAAGNEAECSFTVSAMQGKIKIFVNFDLLFNIFWL